MIILEDLYVASQAKRYQLIDVERLRVLLVELAAEPERVQLVRVLHERFSLPLEQSKGLYDQALRYLRQRSEERYAQLLKRGVAAELVDALAAEQAAGGYAWTLGERLVPEGRISSQQHLTIQAEVQRQLDEEDLALVAKNLKHSFAPILGPRPDTQQNMEISGQLPGLAPSAGGDFDALGDDDVTLRLPSGGLGAPLQQLGAGEEDGLKTMELDRPMNLGAGLLPQPPSGRLERPASGVLPLMPPDGSFVTPLGGGGFGPPSGRVPVPAPAYGGDPTFEEDELSFDAGSATIQLSGDAVAQARRVSGLGPAPSGYGQAPPSAYGPAPGGAPSGYGPAPSGYGPAPGGDVFGTLQFDPATGQAPAGAPGGAAPFGGAGAIGGMGPGQVLGGRFAIQRELGRGAMGVVWLARDPERGEVAVKVVQGPATAEVRGRFEREIAVSKRAVHANVIEVFDAGELPDGSSYMSMEVLGGQSMQGLILREGPQPVERALALLEQVLEGLAAVHGAGIVHRDLKPENIQVLEHDRVKLVDFGVSRFLDDDSPEAENMFQTVKGQLSGTPQYVAPEAVLEPDMILASHDVYACGVSLYELLTGVLPFPPARNLRDMLSNTVNARAIPLDESNPAGAPFDPVLERFVRRLLEKDPEARPHDGQAALELLRETREGLGGKSSAGAAEKGPGFTKRLIRGISGLFKRSAAP